jgi:ribosomal protein S6--L-glutamate ligase
MILSLRDRCMRLAVLTSPDNWYLHDLQRAAGTRHEVTPLAFRQLASKLSNPSGLQVFSGTNNLCDFDALLVRTMPAASLEQVVFRMDVLGRIEAAGGVVMNPTRAIEAAVDKYLASAKLLAAGLRTPRTIVCQTPEDAMAGFEELGGNVVIKPLFGSEGRGMTRVNDEALALRAFSMLTQLGAVIYLQEYVPHGGFDIRLLVLGEQVLAMRRRNALDWRTNVSRGATTEPLDPDEHLVALAQRAAAAVGAPLAGVDVLPGHDGELYVLEVNAVPGWKALARTLDVDVAALVLDFVASIVSAARNL